MKEFNYINDLGCPKKLIVRSLNRKGLYAISIWNMLNGEYCGAGEATAQELDEFLKNYGQRFEEIF